MKKKTPRRYKCYQIPWHLYMQLEAEAEKIRRTTGVDMTWTKLVRHSLENYVKKCKKKGAI